MNPCAHLPRPAARSIACTVAVALLIVQFGCAARAPSLDLHYQLRNEVTALIPARLQTGLSLEPFATGRSSGALRGAGEGFAVGASVLGHGSCSGEICGAVLLVALAIAVAGAGIGAVVGAIQATPAADAGKMTGTINQVTEQLATHLNLTRRVLAKAGEIRGLTAELVEERELAGVEDPQRWQALRARGFVNALEIGVTGIEFAGGSGNDPELALRMVARVRLVDLATGAETYREEFDYSEPPRHFSRWSADRGAEMLKAVERGLERLSADITGRLFEQVALPISSGIWTLPWSEEYGCCWLCPQSPGFEISHEFWKGAATIKYPRVASLQPQLEWEAFPHAGQDAALREISGGVDPEVRYDLRIWEVRNRQPGPLVYERRGLPEPRHRLKTPLRPGNRYFWSFRACFDAGRGEVCTPWASSLIPGGDCERSSISADNYYRFQIP